METLVRIDQVPGRDDMRVYHSREPLTDMQGEVAEPFQKRIKTSILRAAVEIRGVTLAQVKPNMLAITKSPVFEWAEIETKVIALLAAFNTQTQEPLQMEPGKYYWYSLDKKQVVLGPFESKEDAIAQQPENTNMKLVMGVVKKDS